MVVKRSCVTGMIKGCLLLLVSISPLAGQPRVIKGMLQNAGEGKIYLASFYGDRFTIVDSTESGTGSFYFMLSDRDPAGVYRIIYDDVYQGVRSENLFIEFIFNGEDVDIYTEQKGTGLTARFPNSVENQVYRAFSAYEVDYEEKIMELYRKLHPPRPGDPEYDSAVRQYEKAQRKRNRFMDSLEAVHPGLYTTRIIRAFRSPFLPGSMTHRERIDTLKICFFNHAAIDDPLLLHAPVYSYKIIDYLSLFRKEELTMARQQDAYVEAVNRIMVNVSPDPSLRSFVVEYLLEGFEMLGMERVQIHLADHYLEETCESEVAELVQSRMEGYKKMAEGEVVPDFVIRDTEGQNYQLSMLGHPYVVVMFWSTTCEHCREMLPRLHEWYLEENNIDLEFITISIDTSHSQFEAYIEGLQPRWITYHEPLGWEGVIPGEYFIYATPSIFLMDRERTILDKPVTYRQFLRAVRKLEP